MRLPASGLRHESTRAVIESAERPSHSQFCPRRFAAQLHLPHTRSPCREQDKLNGSACFSHGHAHETFSSTLTSSCRPHGQMVNSICSLPFFAHPSTDISTSNSTA